MKAAAYGWADMSNADDIREFLATRRARLTPQEAGLPQFGGSRRVPGLRREEVSLLAGISVEYYTRIERGNARGVSEDVLASISRALQLNEAEHAHLVDLLRVANEERPPRRTTSRADIRPGIRQIVDAMSGIAAFVRNGRSDVLYANRLFEALYSDMYRDPARPANAARFLFLDLEPRRSIRTGTRSSAIPSRRSAARRVGFPMTADCPTSLGCSRHGARSSGRSGHATTSTCTEGGRNDSGTHLSAISRSASRPLPCPRIPGWLS